MKVVYCRLRLKNSLDRNFILCYNTFGIKFYKGENSDELYLQYLFWKKEYKDLPQTITIEQLDNLNLEDINENNITIFRPCPIDLRLTIL